MKTKEIEFPATSKNAPIIAERAFLAIADNWEALVGNIPPTRPLSRDSDQLSDACMLLAVEWGHQFSPKPFKEMKRVRKLAEARDKSGWFPVARPR